MEPIKTSDPLDLPDNYGSDLYVSDENLKYLVEEHNKLVDAMFEIRGSRGASDTRIEVKIPKGYMNCGVRVDNVFIADTNDSQNWDTIRFPLPEGLLWRIHSYKGDDNTTVVLVRDPK